MMKLVDCYDKHKCDKGTFNKKMSVGHRYDRIYEPAFDSFGSNSFDILEIGIFKGSSIEAHLEYAPNAHIMGVDIFTRAQPENIPILNHPNVKWIKHDSTLPSVPFTDERFDIIIDDGLHTHIAQRKTFENFFPYLKDGGVYFIEDVWPFGIMTNQEKLYPRPPHKKTNVLSPEQKWWNKARHKWSDVEYAKLIKTTSPFTTTFHDLRAGFNPDTFIIEVRK